MSNHIDKSLKAIDLEVSKSQELKLKADQLLKRVPKNTPQASLDPQTQALMDAFDKKIQEAIQPAQEMLAQSELPSSKNPQSSKNTPTQRLKIPI